MSRLSRAIAETAGLNPELMVEATRRSRRRFLIQRTNARNRGVEFRLSFEQWRDWWLSTGHMDERGRHHGEWVMARPGDVGAYEIGNLVCKLAEENSSEGNVTKKRLRLGEYER